MKFPSWRWSIPYAVALVAAALAITLRALLTPLWGPRFPLLTFYPAIAFSAWFGGLWPGLVATLTCALAGSYLWLEPPLSLWPARPEDAVALALFGGIGLMISGLFEALGQTRRRLEAKSAALEAEIGERARAEAALRASEGRHRRLAEANIVGIAVCDSRGRVWDANEAFLEMVGFTGEEVQAGKARWDERTPPEYQEVSWEMAKQLQRSGLCPPFEKEYVRPDGRRVSVVMAGAALEGSDQHIAFALDITGRKRAEEALRASEARLAAMLRSTMDAIISVDGAQQILLFNRAAEQMFRCGAQEAIGRPIDRFIPERFRTAHRSHIEVFGQTGVTSRSMTSPGELVGLRADGEEFPIEATISQVETVREKIYTVILRDVTERKRAEEARGRLAAIAESSGDAIIGETLDAVVHSWNPAAERLYGYTAQEVIGREISFLYPPDRAGEHVGFFQEISKGRVLNFETVRVRKDGTLVDISLTLSPVRDPDGSITGISRISRDITARKQADLERARLMAETERARAEAEVANRVKDEFLAILSHELRGPLNTILMWSQVLRTQPVQATTVASALDAIERQTKAQAQLIADLLDVSRIVAGKLLLEFRPVELAAVVEAALDGIRAAGRAKGLQLEVALQPGIRVSGDMARLQQVVWNLVANAVKFTPAGGRIEVRLEATEAAARIVVHDTGQGIEPGFLPHVFDRFRQAETSTSRAYTGLGLGLAIVRHLVEEHGGSVRAESPGPGEGATFTVTLPRLQALAPPPAGPEVPARALRPSLEGLRVLVVDDEADAQAALTAALGLLGAKVEVAASATEALAALDRARPHVLVSDLGMPGEDGYALIRRVRARTAAAGGEVPAVALTAYGSKEDAKRALEAGYQAHVAKPADVDRLAAAIAGLVGEPAALRSEPD